MSEPKTYSASDIARYHRGEMPPAEMHVLEKAALNDPMLADALEGYRSTASAASDLQLLQLRLQGRIKKDNRTRRLVIALPWLKAAAVFLVVAGGGLLVFQSIDNTKTLRDFSANESAGAAKNTSSPKFNADSTIDNLSTAATDSAARTQDVALAAPKPKALKGKAEGAVTSIPNDNEGLKKQDQQAPLKPEPNDLAKQDRSEVAATSSEVTGNQAANVTVRTLNDSTKQVDVVLKKIDSPVDEVVISKANVQPSARRATVVVDSLEPEKGWSSFDDYVAENLKAPDELKTKPAYNKDVELSFDVDSEGNPTNVTVTKSLCEKCDEEAIRILKNGPKWKGKKIKGKVKIKFPMFP